MGIAAIFNPDGGCPSFATLPHCQYGQCTRSIFSDKETLDQLVLNGDIHELRQQGAAFPYFSDLRSHCNLGVATGGGEKNVDGAYGDGKGKRVIRVPFSRCVLGCGEEIHK